MRRRALVPFFVFAIAPSIASAQSAPPDVPPSLDLRGFRASTDPAAGISYEPASTPGHLESSGALWLSYAASQVVLRDPSTGESVRTPLEHSLTGDLAVGVGLFGRMSLGLVLPFAIYQSGDVLNAESRAVLGDWLVPAQAMGDLALTGKVTLIPPTSGDHGGFALALHERFTLPTGDESSFLGEGDVTSETRLFVEYTTRAIGFFAAGGAKIRGREERFACAARTDESEPDPCPTRIGHALPFGLSIRVTPRGLGLDPAGKWTAFTEVYGQLPLAPMSPFEENRVTTVEAAIGARYAFLRDFSMLAGVSTALVSGVGAPPVRGTLSVSWSPRAHDADLDGVDDDVDQCRQLAEDRDGFDDDDGCPEGDNDLDTVPDQADRCPSQKEDIDGFQDNDGCPDIDNDGDQIPDLEDACPNAAGGEDNNPKQRGCPRLDRDRDDILDDVDGCPNEPEDRDNFQDADGCPDTDNDGDTVPDTEDTCPNVPGVHSQDPRQRGCPEVDADNDTFWGAEDKCPLQEEDWNGKDDGDGCPDDPKKKPFVSVITDKGEPALAITKAVRFTKDGNIEPDSMPVVRAVAAELMKHPALGTKPAWSVAIGVRPSAQGGQTDAMLRAFVVVDAIRRFTRREGIAETVGWAAVKDLPGSSGHGIGFLLLTGPASEAPSALQNTPNTPAPK
ncbi:MAG: thrombospondin type 3 repeat-containing protein [Polyangiaceae bacterium]|nr:thrombospondin type 3 repeat-containing protein [Polyangiaceae bacterium]